MSSNATFGTIDNRARSKFTSIAIITTLSAFLMLAALVVQYAFLGRFDATVSSKWWFNLTASGLGHEVFTLADLLLLITAIIAGITSLISAVVLLRRRVLSLEFFATIATAGAIFFGDFWLAAILSFGSVLLLVLEPIYGKKIKFMLAKFMPTRASTSASAAEPGGADPEIVVFCCGMGVLGDSMRPTKQQTVNLLPTNR